MEDFVDLQLEVHKKTSPLFKGMKDKLCPPDQQPEGLGCNDTI